MENKKIYFSIFHTLGDIIVSTAIIRALKDKYPEYDITYATSAQYIDVLKDNPDIKEVIGCNSHWECILRSQEKKYDKVFIPMQLTQVDAAWHQFPPYCQEGEKHNLVDFYANRCNDDLVIENRKTYIYPKDAHYEQIVANIPPEHRDSFKNNKFITIHTTSRNPSKDWSVERFRELCAKIKLKYPDIFIYQIGGNEDKEIGKELAFPMMGMPILNTAALIKKSLLHIDIDSGTSFVSDSLDIPTICLMGATTQNTSGPIGKNVTYIEPVRKCLDRIHTPCHTHCLIKDNCIETIESDEVMSHVSEILDNRLNG